MVKPSYPTVDELLPEQAAHHVGAEVHDVLDLPVGLLRRLEDEHTQRPTISILSV